MNDFKVIYAANQLKNENLRKSQDKIILLASVFGISSFCKPTYLSIFSICLSYFIRN